MLLGEAVGLEDEIKRADLVVTGEGSYDEQTAHGKVVSLVHTRSYLVCGVLIPDCFFVVLVYVCVSVCACRWKRWQLNTKYPAW